MLFVGHFYGIKELYLTRLFKIRRLETMKAVFYLCNGYL